jgi:GT2 family glycosyltransferase
MTYVNPRSFSGLRQDRPSVLAVITHYKYERWLGKSIESIVLQSRPPESIVVIDDASSNPPIDMVERFPTVTLLRAEQNCGPYALLQAIFEIADYDGFLLQDADDFSTPDRLETLITAAEREQAEMVGSQITSIYEDVAVESEIAVPLDPLTSVMENPTIHPIFMPASLVARELIRRVGGLATGLRIGADSEFARRAIFAGRVINVPKSCYFRRVHQDSLTRNAATGYGSDMRSAIQILLRERINSNVARVRAGLPPHLAPLETSQVSVLRYLAGPRLRGM